MGGVSADSCGGSGCRGRRTEQGNGAACDSAQPVWGQGPTFSCACFFLADQRRDLGLADAPSGVHARLNRIGHLLHWMKGPRR